MPAPASTVEIVGSRSTSISIDAPEREVLFTVSGSDDPDITMAIVEAQLTPTIVISSAFFGTITILIQSYKLAHIGNGIWNGTAHYGKRIPRQTGDIVLSFDGTGGTAHIAVSKETVGRYARTVPLAAPVQGAPSLVGGGNLTGGTTYYYKVTAVGPGGETLPSGEDGATPSGLNKSILLTWPAIDQAISYRIYRTTTSGVYANPCLIGAADGGFFPGNVTWVDDGFSTLQIGAPPSTVAAAETPADFQGAIGVSEQAVEGTDIVVPVCKLTYTYYAPTAVMTDAYIITLCSMPGTVNNAAWKGFQPHEVLYLGPTGQPRGLDDWELQLHFVAAPNKNNLSVGTIENIIKEGHDYLWVRFEEAVNNRCKVTVPRFAYVERVYDPDDFTKLGIGA